MLSIFYSVLGVLVGVYHLIGVGVGISRIGQAQIHIGPDQTLPVTSYTHIAEAGCVGVFFILSSAFVFLYRKRC